MRYLKQFLIIMLVTCVGEILNNCISLPIPASIYGLVLMLILLMTRIVKIESVKETADFFIEIMPAMFIPAAVELLDSWNQLQSILFPVLVITVVSTIVVMVVTGKVTDLLTNNDYNSNKAEESEEINS